MSFGDELDRQRAQIMRAVRHASDGWAQAMRAHKLAPPDAGFAQRLRALSEAAADEQVAWEHAHAAGLLWRPVPGAENAAPPYELRPDTGRRGPADLWARFDAAVSGLNRAITGSDAARSRTRSGRWRKRPAALADAVASRTAPHPRPRGCLTLTAMRESAADLERLQRLLDASVERASPFLRSSFEMPERSLSAERLATISRAR